MIEPIYQILKQRLQSQVNGLKEVDYYLGQDRAGEDGLLYTSPGAYIEFLTFDIEYLGNNVQEAEIEFRVHLVEEMLRDNQHRITGPENHLQQANAIFQVLTGYSARLSVLPNFTHLKGSSEDSKVFNSISRTQYEPDHSLQYILITRQTFTCLAFDITALPAYQKVKPNLALSSSLNN